MIKGDVQSRELILHPSSHVLDQVRMPARKGCLFWGCRSEVFCTKAGRTNTTNRSWVFIPLHREPEMEGELDHVTIATRPSNLFLSIESLSN